MRTGTTDGFLAGLESTRRRFDRWRQARTGRSRIPEVLWASAVKAAVRYGLHPTARALRLDYYAIKKRVSSAAPGGGHEGESVATFVELPPPVSMGSPECIVELENPRGAKMRVHLKGMVAVEPAGFRKGIDGLARVCREVLKEDPFRGWVFVFPAIPPLAVAAPPPPGEALCVAEGGLNPLTRSAIRRPPRSRRPRPASC